MLSFRLRILDGVGRPYARWSRCYCSCIRHLPTNRMAKGTDEGDDEMRICWQSASPAAELTPPSLRPRHLRFPDHSLAAHPCLLHPQQPRISALYFSVRTPVCYELPPAPDPVLRTAGVSTPGGSVTILLQPINDEEPRRLEQNSLHLHQTCRLNRPKHILLPYHRQRHRKRTQTDDSFLNSPPPPM